MRVQSIQFLPISPEEMRERDWYYYDFLLITGDAYVDHPSFGGAVISRVLEHAGFRVAILAQPDWQDVETFRAMSKPRLGVLITAGNIDSMVAHYTAAKKRRREDFYSPGKQAGLRPDRATIVYAQRAREAFGDVPIILGGLEASLRRFAHYDYWQDKVRRSILADAKADMLVYGCGETAIVKIASRLKRKKKISEITDIRGTAFLAQDTSACAFDQVSCDSFDQVKTDKQAYATATAVQMEEHDPIRGRAIVQSHGDRVLLLIHRPYR